LVFFGNEHVSLFRNHLGDNRDSVLDYLEAILWFTRLGLGWKYFDKSFPTGSEIILPGL